MNEAQRQKQSLIGIEDLLAPIEEQVPVGRSIRYEATYDFIKEARREDENLPRGIWEIELKRAEWTKVSDLCTQALMKESKDLQIAAWLTEAWLNLEGLKGMTKGFDLVQNLCQRYWKDVYPQVEHEDYEFRLAPLEWMNDRLSELSRFVSISSPTDQSISSFTWADVHEANVLEANTRRHKDGAKLIQQADEEGKPTLAKLTLSINQTPMVFFKGLFQDTQMALGAVEALEKSLWALCPDHKVSFYKVRNVLTEVQKFASGYIKERQLVLSSEPDAQISVALEKGQDNLEPFDDYQNLQPIASRAEAYARLSQAADYLLRTEPHSPTPYLVKRAVSWGALPLYALYQELISDEKDLAVIKHLLGFQGKK